jgi:hypothetical protein
LAAAGLLAAGALTGCQSGAPYAHTGVARGDMGYVATSPAFAQVAAGHRLAADPKGAVTLLASSPMSSGQHELVAPGTHLAMTQMTGQPVVGSGGVVFPIGYVHAAGQVMMPGSTTPGTSMSMPASSSTMTMASPQPMMMSSHPMPAIPPAAGATGQQMLLLVQGPNGPQYLIAEVLGQPMMAMPAPATAPMVMPAPGIVPAAAPPAPSSPATPTTGTTPFAAAAPLPAPVVAPPAATPVLPELPPTTPAPDTAPAPTFNPPPPTAIPLPPLPPPPAPDAGVKAPDPLPPGVSGKPPAGPVLPVKHAPEPSLGTFPTPPTPSPTPSAKLPPATGAVEGDIPEAPIFLPVGR